MSVLTKTAPESAPEANEALEPETPQTPEDVIDEVIRETEKRGRNAQQALVKFLPEHEARLIPGRAVSDGSRVKFPNAGEVTNEAIAKRLSDLRTAIAENGPTPANRRKLAELRKSLQAQLWRCRGLRVVLEADPELSKKSRKELDARFAEQAAAWTKVRDQAATDALVQSTPQRSELMSLFAMIELTGCDGTINDLYWMNCAPTLDAATKARGEWSFMELPQSEFVNGYRPLMETAVDKDRKPYPVTLMPLATRLVFQTRGSLIALGGEFSGRRQMDWWAGKAGAAGAVAFGNASLEKLGKRAYTKETPAALREAYASDSPAAKSVVVCGNHPIAHDQSEYGAPPVTVNPSFVYVGKLYGNEETRADLSFTNPPTNPLRDKIVGSWFSGKLVCPELRDRGTDMKTIPLALLVEVSNDKLDAINTVFSSSNTAWSQGNHSAELELGTNLARAVVAHRMLMCKGRDLTDEEAEAEGRTLNSIFQSLSGSGRPFLKAKCDASKSRVQPQIQRKEDGTPITDAKGEPIPTGKQEMVHEISIKYREGAENFLVVLTL